MASPTQSDYDKFNSYINSSNPNDYAKAADLARSFGFNDSQISNYVGQQLGSTTAASNAANYLSNYQTPSPSPAPAPQVYNPPPVPAPSSVVPDWHTSVNNVVSGLLGNTPVPTPSATPIPKPKPLPDQAPTAINIPADNVGPAYGTYGNVNPNTLASFDSAIKSKDYTGAYKTAKDAGYSDTDIANYIKSNSTKDGFSDPQVNQWINAVNSKTTPASNGFDFWNTRGLGPQQNSTNNTPNSGANNTTTGQTTMPLYTTDGKLVNTTPSSNGLLAYKGAQQYQDIVNFAKAQGITVPQAQAQLGQVTPEATSQYQLAKITGEDSPLMQLAQKSGERTAAGRGLLNSSISAGNAQAEMVKSAQPFALQDSSTYQQQNLANQTARNQANQLNANNQNTADLAILNAGLNTASSSYLANSDYANRAGLSDILTANQIQQQHLQNIDTGALNAQQSQLSINQANNQAELQKAINYSQAYNSYLSQNALQDSQQAFDKWKTETGNSQALKLAGINNSAQLEQARISASASMYGSDKSAASSMYNANLNAETSKYNTDTQASTSLANANLNASVQREGNNLSYLSNKYQTDKTFKTNIDNQIVNLSNNAAQLSDNVFRDPTVSTENKFQTVAGVIAPQLNAYNLINGQIGIPPVTMGQYLQAISKNAFVQGLTSSQIDSYLQSTSPIGKAISQ
jgi:hypothetical protein